MCLSLDVVFRIRFPPAATQDLKTRGCGLVGRLDDRPGIAGASNGVNWSARRFKTPANQASRPILVTNLAKHAMRLSGLCHESFSRLDSSESKRS